MLKISTSKAKSFDSLLNNLIDSSPLSDGNGNKFIVFSLNHVKCYYKSFNLVFGDTCAGANLYSYTSHIQNSLLFRCNPISMNINVTEPLYHDLVKKVAKVYVKNTPFKRRKITKLYIVRKIADKVFDLSSAVKSIMNLIDQDPYNRQLFPLFLMAIPTFGEGDVARVYDFYEDFERDKQRVLEEVNMTIADAVNMDQNVDKDTLIQNSTEVPTLKVPEVVEDKNVEEITVKEVTPDVVVKNSEVNGIDKRIKLDDNMSLKEVNDLCQYITDAINFFEAQGINWRSKIKIKINKESQIDDSCGYPVIINDEDFLEPLPFPDEVVGDQKLANL